MLFVYLVKFKRLADLWSFWAVGSIRSTQGGRSVRLVTCHEQPGASIPHEEMMHFTPCFRFPPISEKFLWPRRFGKKFLFSFAKISDDFFVSHRPQIWNFPSIFVLSVHFPLFRINLSFPLLCQIFPLKFSCFVHALCDFRSPLLLPWCVYASHNVRNGRPCEQL